MLIFEAARSENRAVITNNIMEFRPLGALWISGSHPCRDHPAPVRAHVYFGATTALAERIVSILQDNPNALASGESHCSVSFRYPCEGVRQLPGSVINGNRQLISEQKVMQAN
jgi:hypothetical protein